MHIAQRKEICTKPSKDSLILNETPFSSMQRGKSNFRLKPANSVVIKLCQYLRGGEYLFKAISCYTTVEVLNTLKSKVKVHQII